MSSVILLVTDCTVQGYGRGGFTSSSFWDRLMAFWHSAFFLVSWNIDQRGIGGVLEIYRASEEISALAWFIVSLVYCFIPINRSWFLHQSKSFHYRLWSIFLLRIFLLMLWSILAFIGYELWGRVIFVTRARKEKTTKRLVCCFLCDVPSIWEDNFLLIWMPWKWRQRPIEGLRFFSLCVVWWLGLPTLFVSWSTIGI